MFNWYVRDSGACGTVIALIVMMLLAHDRLEAHACPTHP